MCPERYGVYKNPCMETFLISITLYIYSFVHVRLENNLGYGLLGSEVNKPSKILIKISNVAKYIESNIQNIVVPRTDDPIIKYV